MPLIQNNKNSGASTALVYVTLGALLAVWSGVWFLYENNLEHPSRGVFYICSGLLLTGISLLMIGFFVGSMSRKAHEVEIAKEAAKVVAIDRNPSVANKV